MSAHVDLGEPTNLRYAKFFTANIRDPNIRRAYARACVRFVAWCVDRGLMLTAIRPFADHRPGLAD